MNKIIEFFCKRHLLVNLLTGLILLGGFFAWDLTNKEELPDITFNTIRITTSYSGAAAEDIELYITKPIEDAIQGTNGIYRITSTSSIGRSNISLELQQSIKDVDQVITEVQNILASVDLPDDLINKPRVRVFETSKKAIIDIAIYDTSSQLLDIPTRKKLQALARGLENKLLSQPEIFEIRRNGYLKEEIKITVNPKQLSRYEIPLQTISTEIQRNHVRTPAGSLQSAQNEQITIVSELNTKQKLESLVIQGGFDSNPVKLNSIATISDSFEEQKTIQKVNGHEAILFNIVKSSQFGILEALEKVRDITNAYQETVLKETSVKLTYLDDESIDVRTRLSIIKSNGILGFCLILITLFIFLNKRSGFWVALGIPFTLSFTLICGYFLGYSINGITLASIIIVLGIVVDDAIIVAENISRKLNEGVPLKKATIDGTTEVISPIVASILTTCIAFLPLLFFSGRFGNFVKFIPPIIFLMLLASLFESFFLLPSHMSLFQNKKQKEQNQSRLWFKKWEDNYERVLKKLLPKRYLIFLLFFVLIIGTGLLAKSEFKFILFPNEESREIVLSGIATNAITAKQTAKEIQPIEDFLKHYIGNEGVGIRSSIAQGRRGNVAFENQFRITLEITPANQRKKSTNDLIDEIKTFVEKQNTFSNIKFRKRRYGQSSGSPFEIIIAENNDKKRDRLTQLIIKELKKHPSLTNIEDDRIPTKKEYHLNFDQTQLKQLSINPNNISETLRTILNGKRLFTIFRDDDDIDIKLTVKDNYRQTINDVLSVPITNNQNYLIPLSNVVKLKQLQAKSVIRRQDLKRTSFIYADLSKEATESPIEIASYFENIIFPKLLTNFPSSLLYFEGEVMDSRESKKEFITSMILALSFIYIVLAILFNSILKPLRIMIVIPFGIIGVILAFYLHGKTNFGFYAAIGSLGMLGVVINDAIILLNKLDKERPKRSQTIKNTASIAKTRLRAIILTTLTTVVGIMPTAYGFGGTDHMLSDMMLALSWGLVFGTLITLVLTPCIYLIEQDFQKAIRIPKKTILTILLLGCFFYGSSNPISATETPLTLKKFITLASKHDYQFHSILMDKLTTHYDHDIAISSPELLSSILTDLSINKESLQHNSSLSVTKTLPNLGQLYSGNYAFDDTTNSHKFSFNFSQDIAHNAFGKANKLASAIQTIKTDLKHHQIIEAYEDYMAELITLYYSWIRHYESYQLALSSFNENEKVLQSIVKRQQKKIANETDVNKLKVQILAKKEQLIKFKQTYLETTQHILRVTQLQTNNTVIPDVNIILDPLPLEEKANLKHLQHNRSFKMISLLNNQIKLETDQYKHDLLPSIALKASILKESSISGQIGTSITLPFYQTQSKAKFEVAKINQKKAISQSKSLQTSLITTIQNLYQSLSTQKLLIETANQKTLLTEYILKEESENYTYGKINLNDYIQAVNRYDTTRFSEINEKISYQQLIIEWKRLTDSLITNNTIN